jgi:hypothetical protein
LTGESDGAGPWEALNAWFDRLIGYFATKRALVSELHNYLETDAPLFQVCRISLLAAGEPLLKRAQDAGVVRPDVEFSEVMHMVVGIAKIPNSDPGQIEHILHIALATGRRPSFPRARGDLPNQAVRAHG